MPDPINAEFIKKVEQKIESFAEETNFKGKGLPDPKPTNIDSLNISTLCHISMYFLQFIGPLALYFFKTDDQFVKENAKEDLNFLISFYIYTAISSILVFVGIGILFLALLGLVYIFVPIFLALYSYKGKVYRLPFIIRLIR
ncbi:MAG: DUF4870 domain-containing protein [Patescibacteria group bacterium]